MKRTFLLVSAVWSVAVGAIMVSISLLLRPRLPEQVAVHFDVSGVPDRASSSAFVLGLLVLLWCVAAVIGIGLGMWSDVLRQRSARAWLAAGLGGGGTFAVGTMLCVVLPNLDLADWTEARLPIGNAVLLLSATLLGAVLGYLLGRREVSPSVGEARRGE